MANSHEWQLPEGVTLDELTEYAERKIREKRRQYNRDHPEIVKQMWDIVRESHETPVYDIDKFQLDINFPE